MTLLIAQLSDPHIRLDYLFVPAAFASSVSRCEVLTSDGTREASDHLPLLAELETGSGEKRARSSFSDPSAEN